MSIVSLIGLVFDVSGGDGDTTLSLLGGLVNGSVVEEVGESLLGLALGNGGGQSSLRRWSVFRLYWMVIFLLSTRGLEANFEPFRDQRVQWYLYKSSDISLPKSIESDQRCSTYQC